MTEKLNMGTFVDITVRVPVDGPNADKRTGLMGVLEAFVDVGPFEILLQSIDETEPDAAILGRVVRIAGGEVDLIAVETDESVLPARH